MVLRLVMATPCFTNVCIVNTAGNLGRLCELTDTSSRLELMMVLSPQAVRQYSSQAKLISAEVLNEMNRRLKLSVSENNSQFQL